VRVAGSIRTTPGIGLDCAGIQAAYSRAGTGTTSCVLHDASPSRTKQEEMGA
jgi:hypothetical protein